MSDEPGEEVAVLMISMNFDMPSWAVACAGSPDVSSVVASGASGTVTPMPMSSMAITAPSARVMRQRRLAGPWSEQQGRSVFTGTHSFARKAEAPQRDVVMNGAYVVLIGDVWDPDPWRSHPG
jgi:hypothetical protein